jgi:hypothetical protein
MNRSRTRAGTQVARECWDLLRGNPEWLKIPIFSAVGVAIVTVIFGIISLVLFGAFSSQSSDSSNSSSGGSILGFVLLFLYYFATYGIVIFSETALVSVVLMKMRGEKENPVAQDGFNVAQQRLGAIAGFAALSATVGLLARGITDSARRSRNLVVMIIAGLLATLIQASWSLATFMVTPVIAAENLDAFSAIKRSWDLFKQTWGEQVVGRFSLGLFGCGLFLAAMVPGAIVFLLGALVNSGVVIGIGVIAVIIGLVVISLLTSAAAGIFKAVMYQYATAGNTGNLLDESKIRDVFVHAN